jgi:pentatricopeptide repeat protein
VGGERSSTSLCSMLRNALKTSTSIFWRQFSLTSARLQSSPPSSCIEILKRFHRLNSQSSPATHYAAAISLLLAGSTPRIPYRDKAAVNRIKSVESSSELKAVITELVENEVDSTPIWNQVLRKQLQYGDFYAAQSYFKHIRVKNTTSYCLMMFHALEKNPAFVKKYLGLYEEEKSEQVGPTTEEHFYILIRAYAHMNNVEKVLELYRSMHQLNISVGKHLQHTLLWYFWGRGDIDAVVELWRWFRRKKQKPLKTMAGSKDEVAWQVVGSAVASGWLEEAFEMIQEICTFTKDQPKTYVACFNLWKASISAGKLALAKDVFSWRFSRA